MALTESTPSNKPAMPVNPVSLTASATSTCLAANQPRKKHISFRLQLFLIFAACGISVAIAAAAAYAYSTSQSLLQLYEHQALRATENFAQLSELALLYESGENAIDAAAATLAFPSIKQVAIVNSEGTVLLEQGNWYGNKFAFGKRQPNSQTAQEAHSNDQAWTYWAPVFTQTMSTQSEDELVVTGSKEKEYLGYVYVIQDKKEFIETEFALFKQNIIIGLICGIGFVVLSHFALLRLLAPMTKLVNVMERTRAGETSARAAEEGPEEIVDIAEIYNNVMDVLEQRDAQLVQQKDILETEVELRTQELVQTRDQAVDANRHKSEFLANMSHELRTPLQAIMGYSDIIRETLEDEGLDEYCEDIDRITHNATHLLSLISSILDLSKIEAGRMDLKLSNTAVGSIVENAAKTIRPLMQQGHNELIIDTDALDVSIDVDATKMLQILLNLLSNAGKFTQNGTISVVTRHSPDNLHIDVVDTGIGMSEQQQSIIFDEFRQIDGSTTREFEGTGLGLSITKRFCELMGGTIQVKSTEGQGSCFSINIPLPITQSSKLATEEAA